MKRIVSIQDFSCIGKCSQSVALPVLSAMGMECAALPTALLSVHTAFDSFVSIDLTPQLSSIAAHWKQLGLRFDAIYTGYLGSLQQIEKAAEFFRDFGTEHTLIFVDPVMADHGKLYAGIDPSFPVQMRALCRHADIITPNITEACLLTNTPYRSTQDTVFVRRLLEKLLTLGPKTAIITGVRTDEKRMGVAAMDQNGALSLHFTDYIPAVFHGTGDLFASTAVGAMTLGMPPSEAIALAADYVVETIRVTMQHADARWYGVDFEATLPYLLTRLGKLPYTEVTP